MLDLYKQGQRDALEGYPAQPQNWAVNDEETLHYLDGFLAIRSQDKDAQAARLTAIRRIEKANQVMTHRISTTRTMEATHG